MRRALLGFAFFALLFAVFALLLAHSDLQVLDPHGPIALAERHLMATAALLMLIVVVPVFGLLFFFAWRYGDRAGNHARYTPDWEHNRFEELIWWAVPCVIIFILALLTWTSTHALDPYKPLSSSIAPLEIEVVALDWKWLFIYPKQHIATVNYLEIPEDTPVQFKLTADAPMNSFWIPELSGQMAAMPGMVTTLNVMAAGPGSYTGLSGNFSGDGFSGMHFSVQSVSPNDFRIWVGLVQEASSTLSSTAYDALARPSSDTPAAFYASVADGLYDTIVNKYMLPPQRGAAEPL